MELRDYQKLIMQDIYTKFETKDQLVVTLGMGGGKSLIISEASRKYYNDNKKVVILTNITELIPQLKEHLDIFNLNYKIIKSGYDLSNDDSNKNCIYLIMEQSFHLDKRKELNLDCDILIKDEFHIGKGQKRYEDILLELKPKKVLGLSGTPYNEIGFLMDGVSQQELIQHGSPYELTKKGFLVPLKYYIPYWSESIDYSSVSKSSNDYSTVELDKKINTNDHVSLIVKSMNLMNAKDKNTLVYCNSIDHAENLFQALKDSGYLVGVVHSKIDKLLNEKIINSFCKKDGIKCLVSISKLTTGFNQPKANLLVLCRPTKILRLYLQILFRVARISEGKEFAEVLDLSKNISEHGFGTDQRLFIKSKKFTREEETKKRVIKELKSNSIKDLSKSPNELPKIITKNKLELKMKELRIKNVDVLNSNTKNLMVHFKNTIDYELIIAIAYEINKRTNKKDYDVIDVNIKIDYVKQKINKENKLEILNVLKKEYKKIIKEKLDIESLDIEKLL